MAFFSNLFGNSQSAEPPPGTGCDVHVNVYDLWEHNDSVYWCGFGIFHSGVEVYDSEYAYGAHDFSSSGIFETAPRKTPGTVGFRQSIKVGRTFLTRQEVDELCDRLGEEYRGNQYHLLARNCNHFTSDLTRELTGKGSPSWVNRLAACGMCCSCLLPAGLNPPLPPPPQDENEDAPLLVDGVQSNSTGETPSATAMCPVPHPGSGAMINSPKAVDMSRV